MRVRALMTTPEVTIEYRPVGNMLMSMSVPHCYWHGCGRLWLNTRMWSGMSSAARSGSQQFRGKQVVSAR